MDRLRLTIQGRVQGVGFRYFVLREARTLGVNGWVRNRPDGAVLVAAEGPRPTLERLRALVSQGPRSARVTDVGEEWSEGPAQFDTFEVLG